MSEVGENPQNADKVNTLENDTRSISKWTVRQLGAKHCQKKKKVNGKTLLCIFYETGDETQDIRLRLGEIQLSGREK